MVNEFGAIKMSRMKKPAIEEVYQYMLEKQFDNYEEAESFIDHFDSVGWVVGKARTPMVKWKSAVNTWIRNARKWGRNNVQAQTSKQAYQQESFADQQRRAAARAYEQIQEMELTNGNANVRAIRKAG